MECSGIWKKVRIWPARFWHHHQHRSAQVDRVQAERGVRQCGMLQFWDGWGPLEQLPQVLHVQLSNRCLPRLLVFLIVLRMLMSICVIVLPQSCRLIFNRLFNILYFCVRLCGCQCWSRAKQDSAHQFRHRRRSGLSHHREQVQLAGHRHVQ